MKKRIILIVAVILAFVLFFALGYTLTSKNIKKDEKKADNKNTDISSTSSNGNNDNINNDKEDKGQVVRLDSKIGYEVLKNFEVTNLYSKEFYKLLDNEKLSAKAKASLAFINIMQGKNYLYMQEFSDTDGSTYISKENMQAVINDIFYDSKDVFASELIYNFKFDQEKNKYVIPSIGISEDSSKFAVEVPIEILEYNDKVELTMYRYYISQEFVENTDANGNINLEIKNDVYYSDNMAVKACEIKDNNMGGELSLQKETLKKYIDDGKINKDLSIKVKYTLVKDGSSYKIKEYDRI